MGTADERRTDSGIEVKVGLPPSTWRAGIPTSASGFPGKPPYTRGIRPDMYRGRLWTMRQYSGFGTAESTTSGGQFLLRRGPDRPLRAPSTSPPRWDTTPTNPRAAGEVGKVGVAIDSIETCGCFWPDLPLDRGGPRR